MTQNQPDLPQEEPNAAPDRPAAPQGAAAGASGSGHGAYTEPSAPMLSTIASFGDYPSAQSAVDLLSDEGFEVGTVRIVGHDLKSVELVRGRMTYGKAALYGLGGGAWFGLLLGLLMGLFFPVGVFLTLIGAIVFAAVWGLIFGLVAFAATGQARNFHSETGTKASTYTVEVPSDRAHDALTLLRRGR